MTQITLMIHYIRVIRVIRGSVRVVRGSYFGCGWPRCVFLWLNIPREAGGYANQSWV
jgi:hypothetical protein